MVECHCTVARGISPVRCVAAYINVEAAPTNHYLNLDRVCLAMSRKVWQIRGTNFTNAGAAGRTRPTQAQVDAAYAGDLLEGKVTINTQGSVSARVVGGRVFAANRTSTGGYLLRISQGDCFPLFSFVMLLLHILRCEGRLLPVYRQFKIT
jgi:hypothetical protein